MLNWTHLKEDNNLADFQSFLPDLEPLVLGEEVFWPDLLSEHDVVVEVEEPLGEAGDPVDVGLDGRAAEGGQVGAVGEELLVGDDREARAVQVQPVGDLIGRHQEHPPDPRSVLLKRPQAVAELLVVRVPGIKV